MRVAFYARVSAQRQAQADGIVQQLERLQAHALAQGWTVAAEAIFRDDGYSGARAVPVRIGSRDQLQRIVFTSIFIRSNDAI